MSARPRVSVIIPCYNAEPFIRETIQSVLDQSYTDFELIVLNDGSTDKSEEICRSFQDPRIQVLSKPNTGVADTRNVGLRKAKGEFIAFLDADDIYTKDNLKKKVAFLERNQDYGLVHSEIYDMDMKGRLILRGRHICQGIAVWPLLEFKSMVNSPSSTLIRRSLLDRVGEFDVTLSTSADRDMWIRLATVTRFAFLLEPLVKYRLHPNQMHLNIDAMEADLEVIYEKARAQNLFENERHYHRCLATAEKIIALSYLKHSWKFHKAIKHLLASFKHNTLRLVT